MIGFLRGKLNRLRPDHVLIDVGGVGYLVRIPLSTYSKLELAGSGSEVELLVHTHVREDSLELFGFSSEQEKLLFERCLSVSGIGPRLAQVILSGLPTEDLLEALAAGDVGRLMRIPGVGKKTADRLVLELKDAASQLIEMHDRRPAAAGSSAHEDVVLALVNLGYKPAACSGAVQAVLREHPDADLQELLKQSLKRLAGL